MLCVVSHFSHSLPSQFQNFKKCQRLQDSSWHAGGVGFWTSHLKYFTNSQSSDTSAPIKLNPFFPATIHRGMKSHTFTLMPMFLTS